MIFRPAADADLDGIVEVFLDCWTISYAKVMPARLIFSMTADRAREVWNESLEDPLSDLIVAVEENDLGGVHGVVRVGLVGECLGMIYSLYVSPKVQGRGYGRLLLDVATNHLVELGINKAVLWVFEQNGPSREFYEKNGWHQDGERTVDPAFGEPQIRLAKVLL